MNDFALKCLEVVANICSNDRFTNILEDFNGNYDDLVFINIEFAKTAYKKRVLSK